MNNILTVIKKQLKDTLKNKSVLIQFIMFPVMGIIMTKAINIDNMPANFFIYLFSSMYIGMAPLTSISAIISEEKEKNTLRVLLMADVSPWQYLFGIGCYIFTACLVGSAIFAWLLEGVTTNERIVFLLIMAVGIIASIMIGAVIGVGCKNQMSATSVSVPVMMIFAFLPMLAMFNDTIAKVAKITYSEQVRIMISSLGSDESFSNNVWIIVINILVFGILFSVFYKRRGLN